VILKPQWRGLLIVLVMLALLLRQGLATMLLGLLCVALALVALWSRWALSRMSYERVLSSPRALVGDEVTLTLRIVNRKLLGLPSLTIDDVVPEQLEFVNQQLLPHTLLNTKILRRWTTLQPYEAVSWNIVVQYPIYGYMLNIPSASFVRRDNCSPILHVLSAFVIITATIR
jgi:hypothetical protein